jgi:hypothetical protein
VSDWHDTQRLIVEYLDQVGERPIFRIVEYMQVMHKVHPGATRTAIYRLYQTGKIRRLEAGRYAAAGTGDPSCD